MRKLLFGKLHLKEYKGQYYVQDVYCQKVFDKSFGVGPMMIPNYAYLNCEHTWPQSRFNPNMSRSAQKNDLHHLYPTDARANSSRGNIFFGEVRGDYVGIDCRASSRGIDVRSGELVFGPPPEHRGNVARAIFYFSVVYKTPIDAVEEFYLRKWNRDDPVDEEERERNEKIYKLQGNRNPFIDYNHLVEDVKDF